MANSYYNNTVKLTLFGKAKSTDVDGDFDGVATGFDKLPAPHASAPTTKGFSEAYVNIAGTDETHATNIKQIRDGAFFVGADNSSSANAYAVTLTPTPAALTTGMIVMFKIPAALSNTGACTLNVNSLAVVSIKSSDGSDPDANEIYAGSYCWFQYDGTNFQIISSSRASQTAPSVTVPVASGAYKTLRTNSAGSAYELVDGRPTLPSGVEAVGGVSGLILSNDTDSDHDINVTAGGCMDSTNLLSIQLATEMTKQIDVAWAAGDDAGGMLNGTVGNSELYNVYLLRKDSDGTGDIGFLDKDDSIGSYLPTGYSNYRWIGFVLTNGSANIIPFIHLTGDIIDFMPNNGVEIISGKATTLTADLNDLSSFVPDNHTKKIFCGGSSTITGLFAFSIEGNYPLSYTSTVNAAGAGNWPGLTQSPGYTKWYHVNKNGSIYLWTKGGTGDFDIWIGAVEIVR